MIQAFQHIWVLVRPFKKDIFLAFGAGLVMAIMSPLLPAMVRLLLVALEGGGVQELVGESLVGEWLSSVLSLWSPNFDISQLKGLLLVKVCAAFLPVYYLVYGLCRYIHFYLVKLVGEKVVAKMRVSLMTRFMDQDVQFMSRRESGSGGVITRVLHDTLILQVGLPFYADLVREPLIAIGIIGYMFFLNWKMTLTCFFFLPIFAYVIRWVSKSLKNIGHESQLVLEQVTKTLKEGLDGVKVVKSFNLEDHVRGRFQGEISEYLRSRRRIVKREELGSPLNEWFASLLFAGICLFQAILIFRGESDSATFIAFLVAVSLLGKPVKKTQQAIILVQQNIVSLERLRDVLESESQVEESNNPQPFPQDWKTIEFKNVSFGFDGTEILSGINLTVPRGQVLALVGESGSGKSTLVNLLLRFYDPTSGEILVDGQSIRDFSLRDLRSNIGMVTQDVFLFDDTIENNVLFGNLDKNKSDVPAALKMANALGFVQEKPQGLQTPVGERGSQLSGGEKQRVSIARAVFKNAPILVLDEATSALDTASEIEVQKGLEQLIQGRTAFVIAHRLSTIVNSDRIVVLKDGKIIEEGSHHVLLEKQGSYANYHALQSSHHTPR